MNIAYIRVSTIEQNEERQKEALKKHDIDKWYIEKASAKDTNRPKLLEMIDFARSGDTIYIHSFDRLARSTKDLLNLIEQMKEKDIKLISLKENTDTSTSHGKLMVTMIGAINEFERSILLERQREGIEIAKRQGKYKGRKKIEINDKFIKGYTRYMNRELNKVELAKELDVSRPTLDRLIKEYLE